MCALRFVLFVIVLLLVPRPCGPSPGGGPAGRRRPPASPPGCRRRPPPLLGPRPDRPQPRRPRPSARSPGRRRRGPRPRPGPAPSGPRDAAGPDHGAAGGLFQGCGQAREEASEAVVVKYTFLPLTSARATGRKSVTAIRASGRSRWTWDTRSERSRGPPSGPRLIVNTTRSESNSRNGPRHPVRYSWGALAGRPAPAVPGNGGTAAPPSRMTSPAPSASAASAASRRLVAGRPARPLPPAWRRPW